MINPKLGKFIERLLTYICAIIIASVILIPLVWTILSSLIQELDLIMFSKFFMLPKNLALSNYWSLFFGTESQVFIKSFTNSILLSSLSVCYVVVVGLLASYSIMRFKYKGRETIFNLVIISQLLPGLLFLIPIYIMARTWGLYDNIFGIFIILAAGFEAPFATWLFSSFWPSVPVELEDSAKVDGASSLQILWKIHLPLLRPAIITVSLYSFISSWGEFMLPLILASSNARTLTLLIAAGAGEYQLRFGFMSALTVIGITPPLILVTLFQRYLSKGILAGALKQ